MTLFGIESIKESERLGKCKECTAKIKKDCLEIGCCQNDEIDAMFETLDLNYTGRIFIGEIK